MKKIKMVSLSLVSLFVMQATLVACSKPKQRSEVVNKEIANNLITISDLHDVTSETAKAYFYTEKPNENIQALDKTSQIKLDANSQKVLSLIKKDENKAALTEQLKSGLISFVVLADQVKVYKVVKKDELKSEKKSNSALTLADLKLLKNNGIVNLESQMLESGDSTVAKNDIQFIEISSIEIDKMGVLENQKTKYYNEKMSILNIAERQLDLSTHLVLKKEKTTEQ